MRIIWLEDEPETIDVVRRKLELICQDIDVCQSLASFSDEVEELEDKKDEVIIIDIRMIFNKEIEFTCLDRSFRIIKELESGFEYYRNCLRDRFDNVKIIFFSSKPQAEAQKEAIENSIDTDLIISKDYTLQLIEKIKEIK